MNKLNESPSSIAHPAGPYPDLSLLPDSTTGSHLEPRLIVLTPNELDYSAMTRKIWELANGSPSVCVQLLSVCRNRDEEPSLRRGLAMMCALLQEAGVMIEAKIEVGKNWVEAVRRNYRTGDVVICFAEQRHSLFHRPLSEILQSNLAIQIYIVSSARPEDRLPSNGMTQLLAWTGNLGIIIGSFLLQIQITALPQDWAQTTLLLLSVGVEIWLVWIWNHLFS